jgi:hypothetical protein
MKTYDTTKTIAENAMTMNVSFSSVKRWKKINIFTKIQKIHFVIREKKSKLTKEKEKFLLQFIK